MFWICQRPIDVDCRCKPIKSSKIQNITNRTIRRTASKQYVFEIDISTRFIQIKWEYQFRMHLFRAAFIVNFSFSLHWFYNQSIRMIVIQFTYFLWRMSNIFFKSICHFGLKVNRLKFTIATQFICFAI